MSGPIKVLVVDDEPGLREMLAANLELEGYQVAQAADGAAALAAPRTPCPTVSVFASIA